MFKVLKTIRYYHTDNVFGRKIYQKKVLKRNNCSNLEKLIEAYRKYGHKYANINPLSSLVEDSLFGEELDIRRYGFNEIDDQVQTDNLLETLPQQGTSLRQVVEFLSKTYCNYISVEIDHLEEEEEKLWIATHLEDLTMQTLSNSTKKNILKQLIKSQAFDNFLAKKFSHIKRYGGEGAESMMVFFDEIFKLSAQTSLKSIVLAMPHRGRLNLLTGLLDFPPAEMFAKLQGNPDFPEHYQCSGDVLSHLIASTDLIYGDDQIHVTMLRNPSHLEAVNPVSMGKTRAKQMHLKTNRLCVFGEEVLNIQVHGDAAFAGQGINQECLQLSGMAQYDIGGTIHLVVNNHLGFTTEFGRSSKYSTDLLKSIGAPIVHVNGDHPEEVLKATQLIFDYQRRYRKDIGLDLSCFRRWGHNEMDDPNFTNPLMYQIINSRRSVPDRYLDHLINNQIISHNESVELLAENLDWLNEELELSNNWEPTNNNYFKGNWIDIEQPKGDVITIWNSGIDVDLLTYIGERSVRYPEGFNVHPTILRGHIKNRLSKVGEGVGVDWATAEALAIGSLMFQGHNVRLSGQDVGRGTFSHRHAMFTDQTNGEVFIPLNNLMHDNQGHLEIANSILSEEAVLGYEYGMSLEHPDNLIIWEAQFGDFFNGAQIIFDTFISSGEAKWILQSGLTVLLPHGYDGAGPEHSSSRIERFLQMTDSKEHRADGDDINMQVCQPSTPAQYFHVLRRQMIRNYRKPLIVITPKTLLRANECQSNFIDMIKGTHFKPVLGDRIDSKNVKKVLITSGKHYYSLQKQREEREDADVAIIRIEQFCPFPASELQQELGKFKLAKMFVWCQEEPRNMGAWTFVKARFENLLGRKIQYCGRPTQAAPAVGIGKVHRQQEVDILTKPFLM